ncbi:hypothetical protein PPYR_14852 [Photinus pyralis]|uniref:Ninjurin-1 n=2 Tax=Photinus pyralis TaxID=7054 RepID=A0A5N4A038_PHOPY|nr:hypothetical protein PPYR_14852 [Photinus pyralis]
MMDIALITANANQLRYILAYNQGSSTYYINVVLLSASLMLQVSVGLCLVLRGRLDLKGNSEKSQAKKLNNYIVMGVFLITIINVFIASFTVTTESSS